jgi:outer membrane lipoprotein-sorting protein
VSPRRWLSGLLWISLDVALTPAGASAADTNAVLNEWLAAQTKLHTWTADFTQTRTLKALTQPLIATGHLWFAAPNRFRWELRWPAPTIALRQTDQMLVIYPRLKRAERYPLSGNAAGEWREALALLDAGFPHSRADFQSRFRVQSLTGTNGAWQLTLVPSRAFARRMMKEIRVELAAGDFSLVSTELMFADDSRLRNTFTNAVLNAQFDESVFNWKPEPDFKITEPLGK